MHIIGTAGHVDHGKSSLVIALTGHNPDRLIEEQRRGMTLDLGFAPLRFPDGVEAGIIDVPGHERFLHNMLAGAAGMEMLLLVIAATDGPKRQTFEHLQILNFLNVTRAIIVLTKVDLVDDEQREIAAQLARDACRDTFAANAPLIPFSSVTGEGLDVLRASIHDTLASMSSRREQAPAYLPVDRVFALPGHGTIITGTLMQGRIAVGDSLVLQPSGIAARIRSLQTFGKRVDSATGGARVAVNIPGVEVGQIARGETLVAPREFEPTRELVLDFTPLQSALPLLRSRLPVRVHIGSAEIPGLLRFANGPPRESTTTRGTVSLHRAAVFYPGARLIVRRMSPKDLLGGAVVLGAATATPAASATKIEAMLASPAALPPNVAAGEDLDVDGAPPGTYEVLGALQASALSPLPAAKVAAQANVTVGVAQAALTWLQEHDRIAALQKPVEFISREAYDAAFQRVSALMRECHVKFPWRLGLSAADVGRALSVPQPLAQRLLEAWQEDGLVGSRGRAWHLPDFSPALNADQKAFFAKALDVSAKTPFQPRSYEAIARDSKLHSADTAEALEALLAAGALVRIGDDLYRRSQIEGAQAAIGAALAQGGQATMAQVRDVLGTSRKYALPLMEHFDSIGFTIRDGDLRRLRHRAPAK